MLPAVWPARNTGPGNSAYLNEPQSTSNGETQMNQQAIQMIGAHIGIAKLFQQYRGQPISNKYGVTVTSDTVSVEETICLTVQENKKVVPFTVKNSGVTTVYLSFRAPDVVKNIFTLSDCYGNIFQTIKRHTLGPGEAYKIEVSFCSRHAGIYEQLLVFNFETCQESSDKFEIMRLLEVTRQTSESEELPPTATNSLCNQTVTFPFKGHTLLKHVLNVENYGMPKKIKDITDTDIPMVLNCRNYTQRFHMLLHLVELQLRNDVKKYNQDDVVMYRHRLNEHLFFLQIAGVSKGDPSVLSQGMGLVTPTHYSEVFTKETYKGLVHHVDAEHIYLLFDEKFQSRFEEGMKVNVEFIINRLPLRIQHRAVDLVCKHRLEEVLFPTGRLSSDHSRLPRLSEVEGNPEQRMAIEHIVSCTAKPAPYVVFGPPGTGKTATLVEAIKQIVKTHKSCQILACTPSNSATDNLCERILDKNIKKVYRLYALSFPVRNIPQKIKPYCNLISEKNTLMIPPREELTKHQILLTTLQTSGRLVSGGIRPGTYSHILVDEAGQATETECIIPIAGLIRPMECQVVLAGDPKQLGPVITSNLAKQNGMGLSLLERLMSHTNLYKSHVTTGFNNCFITKLLRNYRSHPAILKIPNELFYKGELQACADQQMCNSFCKWEHLPKKGFPLIFHGVAGTEERDANSPSVYNMAEVEVLKEYLKALADHLHQKGVTKIEPEEIGIITPYRKQVEKIQNALRRDKDLRKKNLENTLVGTVQKFQGKEFNVILLSTVRSPSKITANKQHFSLGFVDDEKRFNVALTRARALLIVVGDPRLLQSNEMWNKFIHYCYKQGGYRGITV